MSKLKLGIDIDEILRAKWLAFDKNYADEFGEEGIKEPFDTFDLRNHYHFEDADITTEVVRDEFLEHEGLSKLSPKEYVVDPKTGKAPVDDFVFASETKHYTAEELFDKFMYEDYVYQIHGSAPKLYMNADVDLNVFQKRYKDYFDFVFFAKTKKEAIPSTLFFLSKMRIECKSIQFVYDNNEIWNQVDWIMTTDPTYAEKPEGKKLILLERPYNEGVQCDYKEYGVLQLNEAITEENPNAFLEFVKNNIN